MAIPSVTVDETGIHLPAYDDVLTALQADYRGIYGADTVLDPDTQDGQLLAIFALAIHDAQTSAVAVFNAFSPSTAQGAGLSSVVKINGIARNIASYSSADLTLVGQAGTTITGGLASDASGVQWALPASVTIPPAAEIIVTATATTKGAVQAGAGAINTIATPTRGWQSVTNVLAAVAGAPIERDATLRQRQRVSTAIPSNTVLEGTIGSVATLAGVTRYAAYENDTNVTDVNGIPSHSIALIVEGGDAQEIANTIARKKTPGTGTYGSTSEIVIDAYGIAHTVSFSRPVNIPVTVAVTVKAFAGYTASIETQLRQAIVDYVNGLKIGDDVYRTRLFVPATLSNSASGSVYEVTNLLIARDAGSPGTPDITIAFNEAAQSALGLVSVTVVP